MGTGGELCPEIIHERNLEQERNTPRQFPQFFPLGGLGKANYQRLHALTI